MPIENNPFVPAIRDLTAELATERQRAFVNVLIAEKNWRTLSAAYVARIIEISEGKGKPLTKAGASALIDTLMPLPQLFDSKRTGGDVRPVEFANVPEGRYAVATEDGATNTLAFYRVDRPTEGRWAGYIFVSLMQSDEEQRLDRNASRAVLAKIAADPAAASVAYGLHIGSCGVCGRTLTNDDSRERGIGPRCAAKLGW